MCNITTVQYGFSFANMPAMPANKIGKVGTLVMLTLTATALMACEPLDFRTQSALAISSPTKKPDQDKGKPDHDKKDKGKKDDDFGFDDKEKYVDVSQKGGEDPEDPIEIELPDDPQEADAVMNENIDDDMDDIESGLAGRTAGRCQSDRPGTLCLNLKFVEYKNDSESARKARSDARKIINEVNKVWEPCRIQFKMKHFAWVDPKKYRLPQTTSHLSELHPIRDAFADGRNLLLVITDNWNRRGSLGQTFANAWTSFPGDNHEGAIIERKAKHDPNLSAHELGHYLGLDHERDYQNLMNPVVHYNSQGLTENQCTVARITAEKYWKDRLEIS